MLKWFTGGKERTQTAVAILDEWISLLKKAEEQPLKDCLLNYQVEIQQQLISFPNLASRYQLIISNCLINDHLVLDDRQAKLAQAISDTLSIRSYQLVKLIACFV